MRVSVIGGGTVAGLDAGDHPGVEPCQTPAEAVEHVDRAADGAD